MSCYSFEKIKFDRGIFDNVADACFILLCCGQESIRKKHVLQQLYKYKPHKNIFIQYNKGYKNCEKHLKEDKVSYDLAHSLQNVFKNSRHYNHILVFEDDFEFDNRIYNKKHIYNIEKFFKYNNNINVYSLGGFLHDANVQSILCSNHILAYKMTTSHAIIYDKKYRDFFSKVFNKIKHVDQIWNSQEFNKHNLNKYMYYKPLCYQLLIETENSKTYTSKNYKNMINSFNLHKRVQPGWDILILNSKFKIIDKHLHIIRFIILFILIRIIKTRF